MLSTLMMLRRFAAALRIALREEDFHRILAAALLLILVGTLTFTLGNGWSIADGFYVAVATLTTSSILNPEPDLHRSVAGGLHGVLCPRRHRHPRRGRQANRHGLHHGSRGAEGGQGGGEGRRRPRRRIAAIACPRRELAPSRSEAARAGSRGRRFRAGPRGNPASRGPACPPRGAAQAARRGFRDPEAGPGRGSRAAAARASSAVYPRCGLPSVAHGSVWTITSTISGWSWRMRSSISLARA
jgi:hypothetical protein